MNKNPAHTDCLLDHIVKCLVPSCKSKGETQAIFSKISVVLDAQPETVRSDFRKGKSSAKSPNC